MEFSTPSLESGKRSSLSISSMSRFLVMASIRPRRTRKYKARCFLGRLWPGFNKGRDGEVDVAGLKVRGGYMCKEGVVNTICIYTYGYFYKEVVYSNKYTI